MQNPRKNRRKRSRSKSLARGFSGLNNFAQTMYDSAKDMASIMSGIHGTAPEIIAVSTEGVTPRAKAWLRVWASGRVLPDVLNPGYKHSPSDDDQAAIDSLHGLLVAAPSSAERQKMARVALEQLARSTACKIPPAAT